MAMFSDNARHTADKLVLNLVRDEDARLEALRRVVTEAIEHILFHPDSNCPAFKLLNYTLIRILDPTRDADEVYKLVQSDDDSQVLAALDQIITKNEEV